MIAWLAKAWAWCVANSKALGLVVVALVGAVIGWMLRKRRIEELSRALEAQIASGVTAAADAKAEGHEDRAKELAKKDAGAGAEVARQQRLAAAVRAEVEKLPNADLVKKLNEIRDRNSARSGAGDKLGKR